MKLYEILQEMFKKSAADYHEMSDEELKDARARLKREAEAYKAKLEHLYRQSEDIVSQYREPDGSITPENTARYMEDPEYRESHEKQMAAYKAKETALKTTKLIYGILQTRKRPNVASQQDYASIPEKVYVGGKSFLKNPYYNSRDHYSGPPENFRNWKKQGPAYDQLQRILGRHNLAMDWIYQGTTFTRRGGTPSSFISLVKGKPFAWYKYDPGGGVGQNKIYINGLHMQLSTFLLGLTPEKQDELLANL